MKCILGIISLSLVLLLSGFVTGCSTSPQTTAYKGTDAVLTTADQAMGAWADYVVTREKQIAAITDPIAKAEAKNALLVNEGRVSEAYATYQRAAKAAIQTGASASGSDASVAVATAVANLIAIITPLIH